MATPGLLRAVSVFALFAAGAIWALAPVPDALTVIGLVGLAVVMILVSFDR